MSTYYENIGLKANMSNKIKRQTVWDIDDSNYILDHTFSSCNIMYKSADVLVIGPV